MENLELLILGIALGLVVAGIAVWLILRARQDAGTADAKAELAQAKAEAAQAKADVSRAATDIAEARQEAAQARAERSEAEARLSDARAAAAAAEAQRDAAIAQAKEVVEVREQLVAQFKALSAEVIQNQSKQAEATAEARLKSTEALMAPVKESLDRFNTRISEVERERVAMTTDLRNQVAEVKLTGEQLRKETSSLVSALRKPQVRGNWGEQQLKRVAELAGMVEHCDFAQQVTTQNSSESVIRPDLKVMLAGEKVIFVDSKVPLTAFLDAYEAGDEGDRVHHMERFVKHVQTHIDQLSKKDYFTAETATPEFVVMFMPSEALAAEAFGNFPDLHEYASRRGIVVASPSSLIAMLKTISYSWRQAALADSAKEVFELGRTLYDRLGKLGSEFNKVGRALGSAVTAYNATVGSIESRVFPTARKLKDLKVVEADLAPVLASEAAVRPLAAPELVEDAESIPVLIGRDRQPEITDLVEGQQPAPRLTRAETA